MDEVSKSIEKEFNSDPVHNKKYLKIKTKYYEGKINTNFLDNEIPREGFHRIFLFLKSVKVINSCF